MGSLEIRKVEYLWQAMMIRLYWGFHVSICRDSPDFSKKEMHREYSKHLPKLVERDFLQLQYAWMAHVLGPGES